MPVHDLGYRGWTGRRVPPLLRPWVVAKSGIALVWRRKWLRLMILVAWLPIVFPSLGIFAFEFSSTDAESQQLISMVMRSPLINQAEIADLIMTDHDAARHQVWATLILAFFRYPQAIAMVLVVGLIAPMMISYDLRSKAYLLYFSRPLTPGEYIVGKTFVVWFFLMLIATIPALAVYVLGVMLSPNLSVIAETWDIPLKIIAATVVLVVPTTALALCYSAFTSESRYATFAWFATWAMGGVAYRMLTFTNEPRRFDRPSGGFRGGGRGGSPSERRRSVTDEWQQWSDSIDYDKWRLLSPYDTLGKVESWVFGLDSTPASVTPSVMMLFAITAVCIWVVRSRIVARLSV